MNCRVVFNTWNGAFFFPGGGEVQLLKSKEYLEKIGYDISLFDLWNPQKKVSLLHQFSIQNGVEHVMNMYQSKGTPIALSTIFWAEMDSTHPEFLRIKKLMDQSDILFSNSDMESEKLSNIFEIDISKFHNTRNSITDDYLNNETAKDFKEEFHIDGDFVLSVANIEPRKNLHSLIMACEQLDIKLISVGHIKDENYYREFLANHPYFKHVGAISDVEMLKSAYKQTALFAMPSICETPGIAAMEAASQGAKVLITDEGSTKEYFEDFVTYASPYSVDEIKNGMENELNKTLCDDLMNHIKSKYTWDKTAEDIHLGYQKILTK